jgi:hypothetical protein
LIWNGAQGSHYLCPSVLDRIPCTYTSFQISMQKCHPIFPFRYFNMYFFHLFTLLSVFSAATHAVFVDLSFPSNGCVDPTGTDSCTGIASQNLLTCVSQCGTDPSCVNTNSCDIANSPCALSCYCTAHAAKINCALSSCWNKVSPTSTDDSAFHTGSFI